MKKTIFRIIPSRSGIILMAVIPPPSAKRTVAVLKMRNLTKIGNFIIKAGLIRQEMLGNALFFPSPPVALNNGGAFDTHIQSLEAAEITAQTRAIGAAAARDTAKNVVLNDMHQLLGYVQSVADANPTQAEEIIKESSFEVKRVSPRNKNDFSVKNTDVSGTVKLELNVKKVTGGKRASFKWQSSTDNITWTDLPATLKGKTLVPGLTHGSTYHFRFLVITKEGESSWSESRSLLVQ